MTVTTYKMSKLKIGVISETLAQKHYLTDIVSDSGYQNSCSLLINDLLTMLTNQQQPDAAIDAWVIDVDLERLEKQQSVFFQSWLSSLDKPAILSEGNAYNAGDADFVSWARQLKNKLLSLDGQLQIDKDKKVKASEVWVLAASTGGPEAIKRFLDTLGDQVGVGFIYVQHIDQKQLRTLSETIAKNNSYRAYVASHGDVIGNNDVMLIPSDNVVELQPNGSVVLHENRQWRGRYKPSVDQVVADVASIYSKDSGVIFFTGMGDDGVAGCRLMSLQGGQVWSQSVESCVASSMPQEVINTGYVSVMDSPENLARHLKARMQSTLKRVS